MKRSEMLKLMMTITRTYRNDLNDKSTQYDMYDKILKGMEDAGMLPPEVRDIGNAMPHCDVEDFFFWENE